MSPHPTVVIPTKQQTTAHFGLNRYVPVARHRYRLRRHTRKCSIAQGVCSARAGFTHPTHSFDFGSSQSCCRTVPWSLPRPFAVFCVWSRASLNVRQTFWRISAPMRIRGLGSTKAVRKNRPADRARAQRPAFSLVYVVSPRSSLPPSGFRPRTALFRPYSSRFLPRGRMKEGTPYIEKNNLKGHLLGLQSR